MDNKWACYFVRNSVQLRLTVFLVTEEYTVWYKRQSPKVRAQIDGRLLNIAEHGYYGRIRRLSSILFEIKFNNGNRVYYTKKTLEDKTVFLILGGNKNGQDKDIKKAQKVAEKIHAQ